MKSSDDNKFLNIVPVTVEVNIPNGVIFSTVETTGNRQLSTPLMFDGNSDYGSLTDVTPVNIAYEEYKIVDISQALAVEELQAANEVAVSIPVSISNEYISPDDQRQIDTINQLLNGGGDPNTLGYLPKSLSVETCRALLERGMNPDRLIKVLLGKSEPKYNPITQSYEAAAVTEEIEVLTELLVQYEVEWSDLFDEAAAGGFMRDSKGNEIPFRSPKIFKYLFDKGILPVNILLEYALNCSLKELVECSLQNSADANGKAFDEEGSFLHIAYGKVI